SPPKCARRSSVSPVLPLLPEVLVVASVMSISMAARNCACQRTLTPVAGEGALAPCLERLPFRTDRLAGVSRAVVAPAGRSPQITELVAPRSAPKVATDADPLVEGRPSQREAA